MKTWRKHRTPGVAGWALAALLPAGIAAAQDDRFNLDTLIEAARKEQPITVYAVTGKIVETAKAFSEKYGVKATGKKVNEATQIELMIREHQAGNVVGDISVATDVASAMGQLLPEGIATSWTPPDIAADIPEKYRNPLVVVSDPHVWTYNTQRYAKCPIDNVWQLTEPEWKSKVAMLDLFDKPLYADWFNQMEKHHDGDMARAYELRYGKKLDTGKESATATWVKAFAKNGPLLSDSATVANAAGAPNQPNPFFVITSTAKYRDNITSGLKLGMCTDIKPFAGFLYPGFGLIAAKTKSPNAAKLFIRYLMTEEGVAPQTVDGKLSGNSKISLSADEPSGVSAYLGRLMTFESTTSDDDLDRRESWQDLWRVNYRK
ncbi:ABC transporter periplasmic solute-binding protein (plasmid) [Neorhizobium galegae bv. officinalis bv. officinalis str. HAMBI 1141]|uniref:ABC transporter periplasmic solute-binding protein n=1 Tax=Neorhizobium galegae bv. officinalis bv. officinalis str. HAMBI 1141 TaxID=1028801 RepID=A0A068TIH5_NEOGA|nr:MULTISPECIES: ABC transporter substrate-binding protein [Neorhizobium]MCJ9751246.1 ABC transporter substrate-binding protein [Neorhizobium sp. BETTINA12A]CDN58173.1 ABC transporter periplasmic solute-binding protein [Neorhizobium galegae bv. officinalis bv. officinalis str. HAMBI 1141]